MTNFLKNMFRSILGRWFLAKRSTKKIIIALVLLYLFIFFKCSNFLLNGSSYIISNLFYNSYSNCTSHSPNTLNLTERLAERERVQKYENNDKFLESILKEIIFEEIPLSLDNWRSFDREIYQNLDKIIPGLGERGERINLLKIFDKETIQKMEKEKSTEGYNTILSDLIPYNRSLPDSRPYQCNYHPYDYSTLPTISIIIIIHEESFSSLARSIHSFVNRTPRCLLKEIIIVDDFSQTGELTSGKMERYMVTQFPVGLIRLIRLKARGGVLRARMIGAHFATGDILFFSDAHVEAENEWAEPIAQRIKENRTRLVAPNIMSINPTDFHIVEQNPHLILGGFKWNGWFTTIKIPQYELDRRENPWDPLRSPVIHGAAFALDRKYFWEMGSFDPDMYIIAGDNLEISFRIWQCGGSVEVLPCSVVRHLAKTSVNYEWRYKYKTRKIKTFPHNLGRVAKIWMDEYQNLYFRKYSGTKFNDFGDLSLRIELRNQLKCKNFTWYLDNVYKEKFRGEYHPNIQSAGQYKAILSEECFDDWNRKSAGAELGIYPCHSYNNVGDSQIFYHTNDGVLRVGEDGCLKGKLGSRVKIAMCSNFNQDKMDKWSYNNGTKQIVHLGTGQCIILTDFFILRLGKCDSTSDGLESISPEQVWEFVPLLTLD